MEWLIEASEYIHEVSRIWHSYRDNLITEDEAIVFLTQVKAMNNLQVIEQFEKFKRFKKANAYYLHVDKPTTI